MIRKIVFLLIATVLSAALMVSISAINIFVGGASPRSQKEENRATVIERTQLIQPPREQRETRPQPRPRPQPVQTLRSGPRFSMALGVEGASGVAVPSAFLDRSGAGNDRGSTDGVDERPEMTASLDLAIPSAIRDAERNATVKLMFCVDVSGRAYDIRVTEENPPGLGLAQAGTQALQKALFRPALRGGQAVPFCGMEQPIEIRFRN